MNYRALLPVLALIVFLLPEAASAISVDKLQYTPGQTVVVSCQYPNLSYELYDITSGIDGAVAQGGYLARYNCTDDANLTFSGVSGHTYSLVEVVGGDCDEQDYHDCVANAFGNYHGSTQFTVGDSSIDNPPPDDGGGGGGGTPPTYGPDKTSYKAGEPVNFYCQYTNTVLELYDTTSGVDGVAANGGDIGTYPCGQPTTITFDGTGGHQYAFLEVSNSACSGQDYDACRANALGNFIGGEYDISIISSVLSAATRLISYPPAVQILSPGKGTVFSRTANIKYIVTDQNDLGDNDEETRLGLPVNPVAIYFSDKIAEWDHSYIPLEQKTLITKNLAATGTYAWDTSALTPGVPYRIIVDALDNSNNLGEYVSDFFTVDFTAPQFIVTANPPATRGEDVTIRVESSKSLQKPPKVSVTQTGGTMVPVTMLATSTYYEGVYKVQTGHDGVANISVQGTDAAGNVGTTTLSGGTFAVGINPPPAPHVSSPHTNDIVATSTTVLSGTTRPNSLIVLKVNGVDSYVATSTKDGLFTIPNIALSKTFNRGVNVLSVAAQDVVGNMSEPVTLQIKYNIAPSVTIAKPFSDTAVSDVAIFAATSSDANGDSLQFTYQVLPAQQYDPLAATSSGSWTTVAQAPTNSFSWDSTEVDDGQYVLRIIADDGIAKTYSQPVHFAVKNTLPFFRFQDGRRTVSNHSPVTVVGRALEPVVFSQAAITKVEYSLNNGKTWTAVKFSAGASGVNFSATFASSTSEGSYGVLWRVKDSRGLIGRSSHPIVIDTTAPDAPRISYPQRGVVLGDDSDEDRTDPGFQTEIRGVAEAQSTVTLGGASSTQTTKAGIDGAFVFRNVTLSRGAHDFVVTASDEAGNTSPSSYTTFTYDNPPEISFLEPKPSRGLEGLASVSWRTSDLDNDAVRVTSLSYRRGTGSFIPVPVDPTSNATHLDVSKFAEAGDYELRLIASDGVATSTETIGFFIDHTPPSLDSFTLSSDRVGKSGTVSGSGTASDALSGIEYVEYAITPLPVGPDSKKEWYTGIITKGYLHKSATFAIKTLTDVPDGKYEVAVRAVDAAGNTSSESAEQIVVDTTPPRVGSFTGTVDGLQISPDKDGILDAYADTDFTVGVSLEDDTASTSLSIQGHTFPLTRDIVSGLWSGNIHVDGEGVALVSISAVDQLGNSTGNVPLGKIATVSHGKILEKDGDSLSPVPGAQIQILELNDQTGRFEARVSNIDSAQDGSYELILRQGSYKLVMREAGYRTVEQDLVLNRPTLVHEAFTTEKISAVQELVQNVVDYFRYSI